MHFKNNIEYLDCRATTVKSFPTLRKASLAKHTNDQTSSETRKQGRCVYGCQLGTAPWWSLGCYTAKSRDQGGFHCDDSEQECKYGARMGRLKMREWKMGYGQKCKAGICRSGKVGSKSQGWKMQELGCCGETKRRLFRDSLKLLTENCLSISDWIKCDFFHCSSLCIILTADGRSSCSGA